MFHAVKVRGGCSITLTLICVYICNGDLTVCDCLQVLKLSGRDNNLIVDNFEHDSYTEVLPPLIVGVITMNPNVCEGNK